MVDAMSVCNRCRADHRPRRAIARPELTFVESVLLYRLWFFARHDVQSALASVTASVLPTQYNTQRAAAGATYFRALFLASSFLFRHFVTF